MKATAVAVAAVALLAGCSGGGTTGQPAGSTKVSMTEFKFTPSDIQVPAGTVVFFLVNDGNGISHDMAIRDSSGKTIARSDLLSAGDSTVFTVDNLAAGTYTIFCDQPGHEASGMHGTLTVT
ncbi:MAG TPA: plastocyanin/azurin family copper-binding protein [Candidatus Micrarchaeaceae archaeon]|nr:plastocyanin/azurin family copper-binding protein [Candidatus Micrarchaeaceae archaeon]